MDSAPPQTDLLADLRVLIEQRHEAAEAFDIFKQDAVMSSAPDLALAGVSSDDAAEAAAEEVNTFTSETEGLIASATDDELLVAYQQAGDEVGDLAAETLLAEIRRRNHDECDGGASSSHQRRSFLEVTGLFFTITQSS